ncbi:glycosyltransferase family 2 protein [bacterium]|nr:glycosyltransferase family 2 protein [bacterium]
MPLLSVIVPCRNERQHIAPFLEAVLAQAREGFELEVLIADGMSDDGTREVLAEYTERHPFIRVIDNPERNTPHALNRAITAARGEVIVRMDVHTVYAPDYLRECLAVLEESGADNVGGAWHAAGKTYVQEAIALGFQSPFSSGGAASHATEFEGEVDSVYLGCWRRAVFEEVGLFDPELVRNQDDELNLRLVRAGRRVWQSPRIKSRYYPRASLSALFRQYAQYGYWKVRVIQKHRLPASLRHLVPGAFVLALLLLALLAPFNRLACWGLVGLVGLYALANVAISVLTCFKPARLKYLPLMPGVFAAFHLGYGYGFLRGAIDFVLLRKGGASAFTTLTRG